MSYYNTTSETGEQLSLYKNKAGKQYDRVIDYFITHRGLNFTPSQVHTAIGGSSPLTSTRRALSDLTADGRLFKTSDQVRGPYGRAEHQWQLLERKLAGRLPASINRQQSTSSGHNSR